MTQYSKESFTSSNSSSRSDFLRLCGVGLTTAIITWFGLDQLFAGGEFRQEIEDWYWDLMEANPPEFKPLLRCEKFRNLGRAFLIVHRGYLQNLGYLEYQDYPDYWGRSNQLLAYLKESGEPTLMAIELRHYLSGDYLQDQFPSCTFLVVTRNSVPDVKKYLPSKNGVVKQQLNNITHTLKDLGISTICCAGESAYNWPGDGGCLNGMAGNFSKDFDLKGIKGCIYPLKPPPVLGAVTQELYYDQIPIPTS
jgi:hypothetical protein